MLSSLIKSKKLHNTELREAFLVLPKPGHVTPESKAEAIIRSAKEEAAALVETARAEAESIRTAAYQEGFQAGNQELEAQKIAVSQQHAEIEAENQSQLDDFWKSIEPEVLKVSIEIARKIIRNQVDENKDIVINTVKDSLRHLKEKQDLKIRVSPNDYEYVREQKGEILSSNDGVRTIEIIDDRRVGDGGCIVESPNGNLDARIETQLSEVERALLEASDYVE